MATSVPTLLATLERTKGWEAGLPEMSFGRLINRSALKMCVVSEKFVFILVVADL